MNLVLDIGNSRTKFGLFASNNLVYMEDIDSLDRDVVTDIFERFPNIKKGIVSTVSTSYTEIESFIRETNKSVALIEMNHRLETGIENKYETANTLGMDRLAGIVGGRALFEDENILVIDAGSCITYDYIDKKGRYYGGAISPGITMKFRALNNFTGNLPLVSNISKTSILGKNTVESISSGVINGSLFEVEGYIDYYRSQVSGLKVIITGGDSEFLYRNIEKETYIEKNLVLFGLNIILETNV